MNGDLKTSKAAFVLFIGEQQREREARVERVSIGWVSS